MSKDKLIHYFVLLKARLDRRHRVINGTMAESKVKADRRNGVCQFSGSWWQVVHANSCIANIQHSPSWYKETHLFRMPRSSSATPSDSSHDSESPRKRAPSVDEDAMELDQSILSTLSDDCEHVVSLKSSPPMLANFDKGLNWSASSALARVRRTKKRKVNNSITSLEFLNLICF
jgi:hypothetical protein